MRKIKFKSFFIVFTFILAKNIVAFSNEQNLAFQVAYNYARENNYLSLKLSDEHFSANVHTQLYPFSQIEAMSFSAKFPFFSVYCGDISFSGAKSKMANPSWLSIEPLHNANASTIFSSSQSKSFESSISEGAKQRSIFAQVSLPLENSISFKPVFSTIYTPSFLDEESNTTFFLASARFPFQFDIPENQGNGKKSKEKIKLELGLNYGTNYLEQNESSWFMKNPYYSSARYSFFLEELYFSSPHISSYINCFQNETSSGLYKLGTRAEIASKIDFTKNFGMSTEGRFFFSQPDTPTISGKILHEGLHWCAVQKFFVKTEEKTFTLGASFDSKYFYDGGRLYEKHKENIVQCAFKADFFLWNFTLKYKYKDESNEFSANFWVDVFSNQNMNIFLSGKTKFQQDTWNVGGKIKGSFIVTEQKNKTMDLEASFSLQDNYELSKMTFAAQTKLSFYGAAIGAKIKKTASAENSSGKTVFELSCGYATKL